MKSSNEIDFNLASTMRVWISFNLSLFALLSIASFVLENRTAFACPGAAQPPLRDALQDAFGQWNTSGLLALLDYFDLGKFRLVTNTSFSFERQNEEMVTETVLSRKLGNE